MEKPSTPLEICRTGQGLKSSMVFSSQALFRKRRRCWASCEAADGSRGFAAGAALAGVAGCERGAASCLQRGDARAGGCREAADLGGVQDMVLCTAGRHETT